MKKLTLLLTMLIATSVWAEEDEFPMKFTCEQAQNIVYVYVDEDISKSWFQYHPSSMPYAIKKTRKHLKEVPPYGKVIPVSCGKGKHPLHCSIDENRIYLFKMGTVTTWGVQIEINRLTGRVFPDGGQCYKGFKEYKKRKF